MILFAAVEAVLVMGASLVWFSPPGPVLQSV